MPLCEVKRICDLRICIKTEGANTETFQITKPYAVFVFLCYTLWVVAVVEEVPKSHNRVKIKNIVLKNILETVKITH